MRTEKEIKENLKLWYKIKKDEDNNDYQDMLTKTIINTLEWVIEK